MVKNPVKEKCGGCNKNVLIHHRVAVCTDCKQIYHSKCTTNFRYNYISKSWTCLHCTSSMATERYNPFKYFSDSRYNQDLSEHSVELQQVSDLLESCKDSSYDDLSKLHETNNFNLLFNNIDGNASNFDSFAAELASCGTSFDIIGISETNIDVCHKGLYKIDGYDSVYQSKIDGKRKGSGLGLYIKNTLEFNYLEQFNTCSKNMESLFVKVQTANGEETVGVIYRPPSGSVEVFLEEFNVLLSRLPNSHVTFGGDFNLKVFFLSPTDFQNVFFENGFMPLISLATHFKPGCTPSCIDNIFTNSIEAVKSSCVIDGGVSHHHPIVCRLNLTPKTNLPSKSCPLYDYSDENMIKFGDLLCRKINVDMHINYTEEGFEDFNNMMFESIDECFKTDPKKMKSKRNHLMNPWITPGIVKSVKHKNYLYKKWKKSVDKRNQLGNETLYQNFKEYRKTLKATIKSAKQFHYSQKFKAAQGDMKKTWKIINEVRGKGVSSCKSSFIVGGELVNDRRKIANEFNKFFTTLAEDMNNQLANDDVLITDHLPNYESFLDKRSDNSIFMSPCSTKEVMDIINDLNNGKSSDIAVTVLKNSNRVLSPILCEYYNVFLSKGIFPSTLKMGQVTPIFKKGDAQLFENYRPVSTLPLFGKIFEKIIYSRLYDYLISNNILYDKQFGFRKNHSTSHAVNYSVDYIMSCKEKREHVVAIFIDLSKAFDTIDHSKLLQKLENYGIRGTTLELIRSYLKERSQVIKFHDHISDKCPIKFGVPQGSVLGPLLFLIYINDIVNATNLGHFVIFADDTNIFIVSHSKKDVYYKANLVLQHISMYMKSNLLHINKKKCCYIYFEPRVNNLDRQSCMRTTPYEVQRENEILNLYINDVKIKRVLSAPFLGVTIDEDLSWDYHIGEVHKKLLSALVQIKRIKKAIPVSQYKTIYSSIFLPHLTYCISVWGGVSSYKLDKLFSVQKRCLRLLFGEEVSFDHHEFYLTCARVRTYSEHMTPKNFVLEHTKPIFTKLNLLTLKNLYIFRSMVELFKLLKKRSPIPLSNLFQFSKSQYSNMLYIPKVELEATKKLFVYQSVTMWNKAIDSIYEKPPLNDQSYIIPGSCVNSDLSASTSFFKNKLFKILFAMQSKGNPIEWHAQNCDITSLEGPCWSWGL
jgi:hypothetical protein